MLNKALKRSQSVYANECLHFVLSFWAIASPKIQLAKSVGKVSAKNLQMLSIIAGFYHSHRYLRTTQALVQRLSDQLERIAPIKGRWLVISCSVNHTSNVLNDTKLP